MQGELLPLGSPRYEQAYVPATDREEPCPEIYIGDDHSDPLAVSTVCLDFMDTDLVFNFAPFEGFYTKNASVQWQLGGGAPSKIDCELGTNNTHFCRLGWPGCAPQGMGQLWATPSSFPGRYSGRAFYRLDHRLVVLEWGLVKVAMIKATATRIVPSM